MLDDKTILFCVFALNPKTYRPAMPQCVFVKGRRPLLNFLPKIHYFLPSKQFKKSFFVIIEKKLKVRI